MDYQGFKDHLAVFLWKQNDTVLVAALDSLIVMANHELARTLDLQRRSPNVRFTTLTATSALPADFRSVKSLTPVSYGGQPMAQTVLSTIFAMRNDPAASVAKYPVYAIGKDAGSSMLYLPTPPSVGGEFNLHYRTAIPDFAVTDESWICDDFLDLYTYTVLAHTAPFLREDDRLQLWGALKMEALGTALDEDKRMIEFGGSPLSMRPHHYVP